MTSTNVPIPSFTPQGFTAPAESDILAGVQQDVNSAFGGNLNFGTTAGSSTNPTPQGQLAASFAAIIGNVNDTFLFYSTQTDPSFAEGRMQDAIGRIYFMERIGAIATTLQVTCTGAIGTPIPIGALIVDSSNNLYQSMQSGSIGVNGTVSLQFVAQIPGFLSVPLSVEIYQAIPGWDTATLISGIQGQNTETRAAFESRRALSTAANSSGALPSILGAVLAVPGVLQAFVYENTTSNPVVVQNVTLAAKSVYVCAYGGTPANVAKAIWSRKAPGCGYAAGNTTVTVQDTSPGFVPPFPSYQVTYQTANPLPLLFTVSIVNSVQVPATATTQIQTAIINAGAGNPNAVNMVDGPAVAIGARVWASRFVPSISALGTWAAGNVISIGIGSNNNSDAAQAFGYCNGTTLTVTAMVTGSLSVGQTLSISNGSGVTIPGTTIVSQVSGSAGLAGNYTISTAQAFGQVNLLLQSNVFTPSGTWSNSNCTVTGSTGTSPDGTNNSWTWQRSGTAAAFNSQTVAKPVSALIYTMSVYAKPGTGSYLALRMQSTGSNWADVVFNLATAAVSTAASVTGNFSQSSAVIQTTATGWLRVSLTAMTDVIGSVQFHLSGSSNGVVLDGTDSIANSTVLIYGAQLEPGSIANTYISTTTFQISDSLIGFATANQTSILAHLDQIPTISANNIIVTYV